MADLPVEAQLITATFELLAVRGITSAIRANTLRLGGYEGPLGNIDNPKPPPSLANFGTQHHPGLPDSRHGPATIVEIRIDRRCDRDDCYARHATRDRPRRDDVRIDDALPTSDAERASGVPSRHESPLVPPWRLPLPIPRDDCPRVVKYEPPASDQMRTGMLLDQLV